MLALWLIMGAGLLVIGARWKETDLARLRWSSSRGILLTLVWVLTVSIAFHIAELRLSPGAALWSFAPYLAVVNFCLATVIFAEAKSAQKEIR